MLETPKAFCTFRTSNDIINIYHLRRENWKDKTMGNQQERFEFDLAWLAGVIEGEGWISLTIVRSLKRSGKVYPAFVALIGVVNTDKVLMDKVKEIFDKLGLKYRKQTIGAYIGKDGSSRKTKWEFSVCSKQNILKLANSILPHMFGEKKNRIHKLFEFYKIRESKPKAGIKSAYGQEELDIYNSLYSYKGKSQSKIPNDYTLSAPLPGSKDIV